MITKLAAICLLGAAAILFGEILRHKGKVTNEASRKIIHLSHSFVVASWPFFIGYRPIIAAEVLFIIVVIIAQRLPLFKPLWLVKRKSWGELFLPAGVILLCLFNLPAWLFAVALLHAGLADSLAALLGKRLKSQTYMVWGSKKSIAGSIVFVLSSIVILLIGFNYLASGFAMSKIAQALIFIPMLSMLSENFSPWGSDNVTVPLVVVGLAALIGLV